MMTWLRGGERWRRSLAGGSRSLGGGAVIGGCILSGLLPLLSFFF
jgi:hypothetical protein